MAFGFFRDNKGKPASPPPGKPVAKRDTTIGRITALGIEVREAGTEPTHPADEAALVYAYGRTDNAIQLLKGCMEGNPRDVRAWRMLFDIHRYLGQREAFEELAVSYAVAFERSPPNWEPPPQAGRTAAAAPAGFVVLEPRLTADSVAECRPRLLGANPARVDFSRVEEIGADACNALARLLADLRRGGTRVEHAGTDSLCTKLRQAMDHLGPSARPHWLLFMELCQLSDRAQDFEDLAIEYAVRFEESPPSWERVPDAIAAATPTVFNKPSLQFAGVVSPASGEQLRALTQFALNHDPVEIDMGPVTRVDMAVIPQMMTTLVGIVQTGKRVVVKNANEMVRALFVLMGLDEFVELSSPRPL